MESYEALFLIVVIKEVKTYYFKKMYIAHV